MQINERLSLSVTELKIGWSLLCLALGDLILCRAQRIVLFDGCALAGNLIGGTLISRARVQNCRFGLRSDTITILFVVRGPWWLQRKVPDFIQPHELSVRFLSAAGNFILSVGLVAEGRRPPVFDSIVKDPLGWCHPLGFVSLPFLADRGPLQDLTVFAWSWTLHVALLTEKDLSEVQMGPFFTSYCDVVASLVDHFGSMDLSVLRILRTSVALDPEIEALFCFVLAEELSHRNHGVFSGLDGREAAFITTASYYSSWVWPLVRRGFMIEISVWKAVAGVLTLWSDASNLGLELSLKSVWSYRGPSHFKYGRLLLAGTPVLRVLWKGWSHGLSGDARVGRLRSGHPRVRFCFPDLNCHRALVEDRFQSSLL